mmetsp:Transcript_1407/g.2864  ORF Transcript_1407/g.2864 Transcript_1407/m.2864 type:complete len:112 (+) Transcript_1407:138-473(+)
MVKIAACVAQVVGAVETFNPKEEIVEIFFQNLVAALGFVCFLPTSKTDCESMMSSITHWHGRIFLSFTDWPMVADGVQLDHVQAFSCGRFIDIFRVTHRRLTAFYQNKHDT